MSEGILWRGRLTRRHLDTWGTLAIMKDDIYVCILHGRAPLTEGENMAAGGFGGLNLAARGTDISSDSIFARKQHLLADNICK